MATIRDVAKQANVSIATVSRIINRKGKYSTKTEQKVNEAIEKLGYTTNVIAKKLKTGTTRTIGLVTCEFRLLHSSQLISTSIKKLISNGFSVEIVLDKTLQECALLFNQGRYDGLLIIDGHRDESALKLLIESDRRFVLLGGNIEREDVNLVEIDYFSGGYIATKQLIRMGHTKILFIEDKLPNYAMEEIRRGYLFALDEHGISYSDDLLKKNINYNLLTKERLGYTILKESIASTSFSSVFTTDDKIAYGVIMGIKELGLSIPDDLSVIGFGNLSPSAYIIPPLTTIEVPSEQMAELGAEILINNIRRQDSIVKSVKLKPQLIERESLTKKCKEIDSNN
ncbi:MAG: LacI family DNA-binding transcriptional regulator [Spirochaetota bacterium]|nr:MAG: LacI family DNA-binding transcriptional regulator [Spirochaetota bacterium]